MGTTATAVLKHASAQTIQSRQFFRKKPRKRFPSAAMGTRSSFQSAAAIASTRPLTVWYVCHS